MVCVRAYLCARSCLTLVTPWTITRRTPPSVGFSRQEYWSGQPFLSPGDLPDPGIKPESPALAGRFSLVNFMMTVYKHDICIYYCPCLSYFLILESCNSHWSIKVYEHILKFLINITSVFPKGTAVEMMAASIEVFVCFSFSVILMCVNKCLFKFFFIFLNLILFLNFT